MAAIASTRVSDLQLTSPRITPPPLPATTEISGGSPGGSTIGAVSSTAATGLSTAQLAQASASAAAADAYAALNGLASKLDAASSYVLAGNITLGSAGHGLYTTGFSGGNGVAFTDAGLVMRTGGVTTVAIPATGSPVFGGVVDCGGGAVVRTSALASGSAINELIKLQNSAGQQFGALKQGEIYAAGNNVAGWEFNFSGTAGALMSAINTGNSHGGRLGITSEGEIFCGTTTNGSSWAWDLVPKNNWVMQTQLNADQVDGYHASDFALYWHNHQLENLTNSTTWRRCSTAHWDAMNGTWVYDEFFLKLTTN